MSRSERTRIPSPCTAQEALDGETNLGPRQRAIVAASLATMVLEGLDVMVAGLIFPQIKSDWSVSISQVTFIVTAGVVGMALGGIGAGVVADRFGRKATAVGGTAIFGLSTVAMAATWNYETLAAARILACVGLGAAVPATLTLVSESVPSSRRAQLVSLCFSGVALGSVIAGLLGSAILPIFGWRVLVLVAGIAPTALIPVLILVLLEPPAGPTARGFSSTEVSSSVERVVRSPAPIPLAASRPVDPQGQQEVPAGVLFSREMFPITVLIWAMFFVGVGSAFVFGNYLPIMARDAGFSTVEASLSVGVLGWGGLVGQVTASFALKRLDRFKTVMSQWLIGAVATFSVAVIQFGVGAYMVLFFVIGFALTGATATLNAIGVMAYSPLARARGTGAANAAGRIGTIASGLAVGVVLNAGWKMNEVITSVGFPLLVGVGSVVVLRAHLAGMRRIGRRRARSSRQLG